MQRWHTTQHQLRVGASMKVTVKNTMWERRSSYFFEVPEFHEYEGDEVKVKWVTPNQLALSTGNPEFSFRVIEKKYIVKIDDMPFTFESGMPKTKIVKGSKGDEYVVTLGATPHCTCPGFQFRKSCKHTLETA